MIVNKLDSKGIDIPEVIIGCGTFGGIGKSPDLIGKGLETEAAFATLDEALALGLCVLDTAERYALGQSEKIIGQWLDSRAGEDLTGIKIATKVAPPETPGKDDACFDRAYIETKLEQSLERLGLAKVCFYLSHEPDRTTPIEDTMEGFASVVEAGKVQHLGCCNVGKTELTEALDASERLGLPGFEWVQNGFSLLTPGADSEIRAVCRERGLGYTPFSPLAGGVLTGKYQRGQPFPSGTRMALRPEGFENLLTNSTHDALDELRSFAAVHDVSCGAVALAWIIAHDDCSAPVVGPSRTAPHLGHVKEALAIELSEEDHARLTGWFENARP